MADKKINIHIETGANLAAMREVNMELAKMAMNAKGGNGDLRQATMLAEREFYNLGDASEKAASRAVLSARQIEEAWRQAMVKPTEAASKGFGRLSEVAHGAMKGIGGAFGKLGEMLMQGSIWGVLGAVITKAVSVVWENFAKESERAAKRAERAFKEATASIKDGASAIDKAFEFTVSGIDKAISRFNAMQNSVEELTKAEIELAKQHAIANGMDPATVSAAAEDLSAQVDYEAEEQRLQNLIAMEEKRIAVAKDAEAKTAEEVKKATDIKLAAEAEYQKKREEYIKQNARTTYVSSSSLLGYYTTASLSEEEIAKNRAKAAEDFDESEEAAKMRDKIRTAKEMLAGIKTDEKALAAADEARVKIEQAQAALDALAIKREARELAVQNEIAAKVETDNKERSEKEKAASVEREKAEKAAAQAVARERERLDREIHQKRIADLRAEMEEQKKAQAPLQAVVSQAKTEFERAFAMYRDPSRAAAEIGEEKDRAEDLERLHKEAARYNGRWRIDELSRLMSAGDTEGVSNALQSWRKFRSFSPEIEAMVRASAAERTKTSAEESLRNIETNTKGLSDKLDELLKMK